MTTETIAAVTASHRVPASPIALGSMSDTLFNSNGPGNGFCHFDEIGGLVAVSERLRRTENAADSIPLAAASGEYSEIL